jgi:Glycosyl transferase family 8
MRGRILYTLCSRGRDRYSTMARVSVLSMRISNPEFEINLLVDRQSLEDMESTDDLLLSDVDNIITFDIPDGDDKFRSRYLKTSARQIVDGAFLMLDCDTIVREDLGDLFLVPCDVAGAPNHSKDSYHEQFWDDELRFMKSINLSFRSDIYVNTGVLFFNNTESSRRAGKRWHDNWLSIYRSTGRYQDQPAFNSAICDGDIAFEALPHRFNAQVRVVPELARDAAILHFYTSVGGGKANVFDSFVDAIYRGKILRRSQVQRAVQRVALGMPNNRLMAGLA